MVHFNVFRALVTNSQFMALSHIFSACSTKADVPFSPPSSGIPESLLPTSLQLEMPHEPSVDCIPLPRLRDNAILSDEILFASADFCQDMLGGLYRNQEKGHNEPCGLVVWGDPWNIDDWECTPGFVRKWGWLLDGCEELVYATNRWRATRGEDPLDIEES